MSSVYKIGATEIKVPRTFRVARMPIEHPARVSSGKLVVDYVTSKQVFHLYYDDITGSELNTLMSLLTATVFFDFTFPGLVSAETATVKLFELLPRRFALDMTDGLYDEVDIRLIEQ